MQTRTAGNPLFAVQLVGEWIQRGLLEASASGFQLRDGAEPSLPDSLSKVWTERVDTILASRPDADEVALGVAQVSMARPKSAICVISFARNRSQPMHVSWKKAAALSQKPTPFRIRLVTDRLL